MGQIHLTALASRRGLPMEYALFHVWVERSSRRFQGTVLALATTKRGFSTAMLSILPFGWELILLTAAPQLTVRRWTSWRATAAPIRTTRIGAAMELAICRCRSRG